MNPVSQQHYLKAMVLPETSFLPLPERARPGGSSLDIQYFKEKDTGDLWIGKCDMKAGIEFNYTEECKELLALRLYALLGIKTPEVVLSPQQMAESVRRQQGDWIERIDEPRYHIMSRFQDGFHELGETFVEDYILQYKGKDSYYMIEIDGERVPIKGFGAALAAANFLHDYDCVGNAGKNMGYVIDPSRKHAEIFKIDAGYALPFLVGLEERIRHNPQTRDMLVGTTVSKFAFEDLSKPDQAEFTLMVEKILGLPELCLRELFDKVQGSSVQVRNGLTKEACSMTLSLLLARRTLFLRAFAPEVQKLLVGQMVMRSEEESKNIQENWGDLGAIEENKNQKLIQEQLELWLNDYKVKKEEEKLLKAKQIQAPMANSDTKIFQLLLRNPYFSARSGEIEVLTKFFLSNKEVNIACVVGLSGMGKSQLAGEYAYRSIDVKKYQHVLWLNAEYGQLLAQMKALVEIWTSKKMEKAKDIVEKFYENLGKENTLILVDNVGHQDGIKDCLPKKKSKNRLDVLICSQYQGWTNITKILKLGQFSEKDTQEYYEKVTGVHDENIKRFHDYLGGFPTAIAQATSFIKINGIDWSTYCDQFAEEISLLSEQSDSELKTISTTLTLTLSKLKRANQNIDPVLSCCAFLYGDSISKSLIKPFLNLPDNVLDGVLRFLHDYSLISLQNNNEEIRINHLVQSVLILIYKRSGIAEKLHEDVFAWLSPQLQHNQKDQKDIMRVSGLIPHGLVLASFPNPNLNPIKLVALWEYMGKHQLYGVSNHEAARTYFMKAMDIVNLCYEEKPEARAYMGITSVHLGNVCIQSGDYVTALPLLLEALEILQEEHKVDLIEVAEEERGWALHSLGNTFLLLGNQEEALKAYTLSLETYRKVFDEEHEKVGTVLGMIGSVLINTGECQKAVEILSRAIKIFEKEYGSNHPSTALLLINRATAQGKLGDRRKQYETVFSVVSIFEEHYGKEHLETGKVLVSLGEAFVPMEEYRKAIDIFNRVLVIFEKQYFPDHPKIAGILDKLGTTWTKLYEWEKGVEYINKAIDMSIRYYGLEHPIVADMLESLAGPVWMLSGDPREGEKVLEKAIEVKKKVYGPRHPKTAQSLLALSRLYKGCRRYQEQYQVVASVLPIFEEHYGKEHLETATVLSYVGEALILVEECEKGRGVLITALGIFERCYPPGHEQIGKVLTSLGYALNVLGDKQKAIEVLNRAVKIMEEWFGVDHLEVVNPLRCLCAAWLELDPDKGISYVVRTLKIKEKHYGPEHLEIVEPLIDVSKTYGFVKDYKNQEEVLTRIVYILEKNGRSNEAEAFKHELAETRMFAQFAQIFRPMRINEDGTLSPIEQVPREPYNKIRDVQDLGSDNNAKESLLHQEGNAGNTTGGAGTSSNCCCNCNMF